MSRASRSVAGFSSCLLFAAVMVAGAPRAWAQAPMTCDFITGAKYHPRGDHWPAGTPFGDPVVEYRISTVPFSGLDLATAQQAIARGMTSWMNVRCPEYSCATHTCDGDGPVPNIRVVRGPDWPGDPGGPQDNVPGDFDPTTWDINHVVYPVKSDWAGHFSVFPLPEGCPIENPPPECRWASSVIAYTINSKYTSQHLVSSDIVWNDEHFNWRVGAAGCAVGPQCYDVERVAVHEFGHFLGFDHVTCVGAIMQDTANYNDSNHALTDNETKGMCALYPPRPNSVTCAAGSDCRAFGEFCTSTSQCQPREGAPSSARCANDPDVPTLGKCTWTCSNHSDCPTAHGCFALELAASSALDAPNSIVNVCLPAPKNFEGAGGVACSCDVSIACDDTPPGTCTCDPDCLGGGGGPGSTGSGDVCASCAAPNHCKSGVCIEGLCVETCAPGGNCASGFDCLQTTVGYSVCFPTSDSACAGVVSTAGRLNDLCYLENVNDTSAYWYNPCGPDLTCFPFIPRCQGMAGACVSYCNATDRSCPAGTTCCFAVDAAGNCITSPGAPGAAGGCFNIRREGESCVIAENSICQTGLSCQNFGDASQSRCYANCNSGTCPTGSTCNAFGDACSNQFNLCCDNQAAQQLNMCLPSETPLFRELGVQCNVNADCDSGLCLKFEGSAACSRACRLGAGNGCPENVDLNNDGIEDGTFTCRLIQGDGYCWPDNGPIAINCNDMPDAAECQTQDPPGGCCAAVGRPLDAGQVTVNLLVWLPVLLARRRRRR